MTTFNVGNGGLVERENPPPAPGSAANSTTYDNDGNITRAVDEAGVGTSYSYDAQGHVTAVTRDAFGPDRGPVRVHVRPARSRTR